MKPLVDDLCYKLDINPGKMCDSLEVFQKMIVKIEVDLKEQV